MLANPSSSLIQMMLPATAKWVMKLISTAASYYLLRWMRCAEVTCDRAGLVCCGDLATAETTLLKLYGGSGFAKQVNVEEYLRQEEDISRLAELKRSEPLMQRRIKALRLFAECDTLLEWRPEMKTEKTRPRADIDGECEKIFSVL